MDVELNRARTFFGRRKGHKLRKRQAELFDTLLPRLAIDLSGPAPTELRTLFPVPVTEIELEIGFGGGESMIAQALARPGTGFIGIEPFANGMAKALAAIERESLPNVRLHFEEAASLIAWLPDGSMGRVDLIHPDPWPKRRHWKRRFVQDATVDAARPHPSSRRRIALRHRRRRLCRLDPAAPAAFHRIRLDGAIRRRLAQTLARLHDHALPRQGGTRGAPIVLPDFPQGLTAERYEI